MAPSCVSGAAVDSFGAVGCGRHLAGVALLPGAALVGGGQGHGVVGGCGGTEGGNSVIQQQAVLLYKTFTLFCTIVRKNSTVINLYCLVIHLQYYPNFVLL